MTDAELIQQFEACTLPFEQWTHRTHVKVAYLYLETLEFSVALPIVCAGIRRYNAANRVPEGPMQGYNETTTRALLHLIAAVRKAYAEVFPAKNADEFCDLHPELMSKHALRFFYSPQRRMDPRAKAEFVEPDLTDLPRIGGKSETRNPNGGSNPKSE